VTDDPTALALLRAVLGRADDDFAARDDDTPRLLYADRLDELAGTVPCGACGGGGVKAVGVVKKGGPEEWGPWKQYVMDPPPPTLVDCPACSGSGRVPDALAARAELVRVQCEIHWREAGGWKGGSPDPAARLDALRQRKLQLLSVVQDSVRTALAGAYDGVWWQAWEFRRGFVESLSCTAADWLAHANPVYWHEKQRVPCEACDGRGYIEIDCRLKGGPEFGPERVYIEPPLSSVRHGCQACGGDVIRYGTGTVPRPCPPTAQPVTEVRLTSLPPELLDRKDWGRVTVPVLDATSRDNAFTCDRFPGVTFRVTDEVFFQSSAGTAAEGTRFTG